MKIRIDHAAKMYFALKQLESERYSEFNLSYRIGRNLDLLEPIAKRYEAEMKARIAKEPDPEKLTNQRAAQLDIQLTQEWESSGEIEDLALRMLDFSKESNIPAVGVLRIIDPLIETPTDN